MVVPTPAPPVKIVEPARGYAADVSMRLSDVFKQKAEAQAAPQLSPESLKLLTDRASILKNFGILPVEPGNVTVVSDKGVFILCEDEINGKKGLAVRTPEQIGIQTLYALHLANEKAKSGNPADVERAALMQHQLIDVNRQIGIGFNFLVDRLGPGAVLRSNPVKFPTHDLVNNAKDVPANVQEAVKKYDEELKAMAKPKPPGVAEVQAPRNQTPAAIVEPEPIATRKPDMVLSDIKGAPQLSVDEMRAHYLPNMPDKAEIHTKALMVLETITRPEGMDPKQQRELIEQFKPAFPIYARYLAQVAGTDHTGDRLSKEDAITYINQAAEKTPNERLYVETGLAPIARSAVDRTQVTVEMRDGSKRGLFIQRGENGDADYVLKPTEDNGPADFKDGQDGLPNEVKAALLRLRGSDPNAENLAETVERSIFHTPTAALGVPKP